MPSLPRTQIIGLILIVAIALVVAWGASSYYGERRMGQDEVLRADAAVAAYTQFAWSMESAGELILDPAHIAETAFSKGDFSFRLVDDTYFLLNLQGRTLTPDYHFHLSVNAWTEMKDGRLGIYLYGRTAAGEGIFATEPLPITSGRQKIELDFEKLTFTDVRNPGSELHWGREILDAHGLRLDWDGPAGSRVVVYHVAVRSGLRVQWMLADHFTGGETQGIGSIARELRLTRGARQGWFISPAFGVGSIDSFIDLAGTTSRGEVSWTFRSGHIDTLGQWQWSEWMEPGEDGSLSALPPAPFFQVRVDLRRLAGAVPMAESFSLRLFDSRPPGSVGPFAGGSQIPWASYRYLRQFDDRPRESGEWLRLRFSDPDFERWVEDLVGRDITIVVSVDLASVNFEKLLRVASQYRTRIAFWELLPKNTITGPESIALFDRFRAAAPWATVFPQRIDGDFFRDLSLRSLGSYAREQGSVEENLDRGFWWYFVVVLIGILLVVSLGPVIGYNFRFGPKEMLDALFCLLISAAVVIPLMYLLALGGLTLPRDFAQIQVAASRFLLSSFVQEFLRAVALLLGVRYLVQAGVEFNRAWLIAIGASSLFFGLGHLGYPGFTPWEVIAFIVVTTAFGVILAIFLRRSHSLTVIALVHFIANIFFSTMTAIGPRF